MIPWPTRWAVGSLMKAMRFQYSFGERARRIEMMTGRGGVAALHVHLPDVRRRRMHGVERGGALIPRGPLRRRCPPGVQPRQALPSAKYRLGIAMNQLGSLFAVEPNTSNVSEKPRPHVLFVEVVRYSNSLPSGLNR